MENQFEERLRFFVDEFEKILNEYLGGLQLKPDILNESVRYSLQVGGKRVRPALMFASAQMLGGKIADVSNFALALELIHTYSLIHDDLPAMDNDDYRRGRLTNHKVYGEAMAILAGDALLTDAFSLAAQAKIPAENAFFALSVLSECAGSRGMVGGQVLDILSEERVCSEQEVLDVLEKALLLFRDQGIPGERFADTIARLGFENVEAQLLSDDLLRRKEEILGKHTVGGATC